MSVRKIYMLLIGACCAICSLQGNAQLSNAGLIVHMPLNGNVGDSSGNGYHGLLNGPVPTTDASGNANSAMYFGLNSKVTINNPFLLRGPHEELTILIKVYMDSIPSTWAWGGTFFSWLQNVTVPFSYQVNQLMLSCYAESTVFPPPLHQVWGVRSYNFETPCSYTISIHGSERDTGRMFRQWFSYAFVFNRGIVKHYFNCKKVTEYAAAFGTFRSCPEDSANEINIYLGNVTNLQPGNIGGNFTGKLDELRIYKRALSDDEIKAYAGNLCKPEIVPFIGVKKKNCSNTEFTISDESVTYGIPVTAQKWRIVRDNFNLSGTGSFDYTFTRTGNYTIYLEVTDHEGYRYWNDTTIYVNVAAKDHFIKSPQDVYYLCGDQKSVKVNLSGALNYQWSPCAGLSNCTGAEVTVTPQADQQYRITGSNAEGCMDTIFISVKRSNDSAEVFVPSAFTPNNDGVNDVLGIQSNSPPSNFEFEIYNRWGALVFKTRYALATWNGELNNKRQPAGMYIWKLRYSGGPNCPETRKKGTVMLIR